mgnify:CR=1 FL=1
MQKGIVWVGLEWNQLTLYSHYYTQRAQWNSATQYGLDSDKETEAECSEHTKGLGVSEIDVYHPGLTIIAEAPELAASPDGFVCEDPGTSWLPLEYIVGYKNPKSLIEKKLSVDKAITNVPGFALELSPNGYSMKRNHNFYYQIQGAMKAANVTFGAVWLQQYSCGQYSIWCSLLGWYGPQTKKVLDVCTSARTGTPTPSI